jgi:hypothetical protein
MLKRPISEAKSMLQSKFPTSKPSKEWNITIEAPQSNDDEIFEIKVSNFKDPSQCYSLTTCFVNTIPQPIFNGPKRWESLNQSIQYRNDDIIVCTFPKCGTTWTEQAILLLLNNGDASLLDPATKNSYQRGRVGKIWPEASVDQNPELQRKMGREFTPVSLGDFNGAPSPRVIKSHAHRKVLLNSQGLGIEGLPAGTKLIITARNPLDACVSAYYHAFNPCKCGWPFEGLATLFC